MTGCFFCQWRKPEQLLFFLGIYDPSVYIQKRKHGVSGLDGFAAPGCGYAVHSFYIFSFEVGFPFLFSEIR